MSAMATTGMMQVGDTRLANGLRVVTAAMPRVEGVSLGIWAGVGSRHETAAQAGMSHFMEHLLFKGTARRSSRAISSAIEGYGGYLNAFTQEESTCFYARVTYDRTASALDVLADMYTGARLDPRDIERERAVIIEEIMMYRDQPEHVVQEMLTAALWRGHPVGRPVIGSVESLQGMAREHLAAFRDRYYNAANTVVTLAGRVDHDDCVHLVERVLGGLPRGRRAGARRVTGRVGQRPRHVERKAIEQSHFAMGLRLFGYHDPRRYALKLLNVVLGENMSSRLFQVVRERRGLAYAIHSQAHLLDDTGALVVSAGLDRRRALQAVELVVRELRRLKETPVTRQEFNRAREYVTGQLRLGLERSSRQMMWLGSNILGHDRVVPPEEAMEHVRAVTLDDVQSLAAEWFTPAHASAALLAPDVSSGDGEAVDAILAGL